MITSLRELAGRQNVKLGINGLGELHDSHSPIPFPISIVDLPRRPVRKERITTVLNLETLGTGELAKVYLEVHPFHGPKSDLISGMVRGAFDNGDLWKADMLAHNISVHHRPTINLSACTCKKM